MKYKKICEEIINTLENTIDEFKEEIKYNKEKTYTGFEIIQILESIMDIKEDYE